jgi:hypothetical protein
MAGVAFKELHFEDGLDVSAILYRGPSGSTLVQYSVKSVDFQEHGVLVETIEGNPSPTEGDVRHLTFVPYSALISIAQDQVLAQEV